jgi:hypothetical protein
MIPSFVGRPWRLVNRHANADIPCVHKTISAIRWSDSRVFAEHIVGVYEVDQAIITTAFTVASASRKELYLDTSYDFIENYFTLSYSIFNNTLNYVGDPVGIRLDSPAILIGGSPEDGSWFHWTLNWAPRLSLLAELRPDLLADPSIPIIFHEHVGRPPFTEYLSMFGIARERCVFLKTHESLACDKLYVPTFTSQMLYAKPYITDIAERCLRFAGVEKRRWAEGGTAFHLSRQNFLSARRRIANFDAVSPIFERHGIDLFVADGLSLAEQVRTFANASTVVAVHGAGLANIIFTPPGADIVILDYKRYVDAGHTRMFVVLAEMMGHRPFVIACDEQDDGRAGQIAHHRDVVIDAAELDNVLARIAYSQR